MTDDQKKYYAAMKKMGNKKPVKATPRPRVKPIWNCHFYRKPHALILELTLCQKATFILCGSDIDEKALHSFLELILRKKTIFIFFELNL